MQILSFSPLPEMLYELAHHFDGDGILQVFLLAHSPTQSTRTDIIDLIFSGFDMKGGVRINFAKFNIDDPWLFGQIDDEIHVQLVDDHFLCVLQ